MKQLLIITFIFFAQTVLSQSKAITTSGGHLVTIKTSSICEMCKETLESDLTFEKGVRKAEVDLSSKMMTIAYNPKKTNPDKLRKQIASLGYHADGIKRDSLAYEKLPFCCKDGAEKLH